MCTSPGCPSAPNAPAHLDGLVGRRGFLKASAALALGVGLAAAPGAAAAPAQRVPVDRICLQLYTCRDQLTADPLGTLKALRAAGYRSVEHAGYADLSAAEFRAVADRAGVRVPTGHTNIPFPYDDAAWRAVCRDAVTVGQRYVIEPLPLFTLPVLLAQQAGAPAGLPAATWSAYAATLVRAATVAKEYGLRVGYHNHAVEFTPALGDPRGRTGFDILLGETPAGLVDFTLDLYWSWNAGVDPVALLKRHPGRIKRFHVKDMDADGAITTPGTGVIDFRRIFRASQRLGVQLYTVEHDNAADQALAVARAGHRYLTTLRY